MNKRGQLGLIEFKFFIYGLVIGVILILALVFLSSSGVLPFQIPFLCPVAN